MHLLTVLLLLSATPALAAPKAPPDCTGSEAWPASMAFTLMRNAELLSHDTVDITKTKVVRLASEPVDKRRFRQVHRVTFPKKDGGTLEAIVVNLVSHTECSEDHPEVYVVSRKL